MANKDSANDQTPENCKDSASIKQTATPLVSFEQQISPLFRSQDVFCMDPRGVKLKDYMYMSDPAGDTSYVDHANANHVYARLTGAETPRMPAGGHFWSQANLDLFKQWMQDGYQR